LILKRFAQLSGSRLKRGPEDEPIGIALKPCAGTVLWGVLAMPSATGGPAWLRSMCRCWQWPPRATIKRRSGLAASCLTNSAASTRQYLCLGRKQGFSGDFGHVEMLVSKAAQAEVWPLVQRWLNDPLTPLVGSQAPVLESV
jgi:hypothetical protein